MSDKVRFVPDGVRDIVDATLETTKKEVGKTVTEAASQIFGTENNKKTQETKKMQEKAEKNGRAIEEQTKIESIRRQLHQQVTAPLPKNIEEAPTDQDNVGTNEEAQKIRPQSDSHSTLSPLSQPSQRRGERLRIRE